MSLQHTFKHARRNLFFKKKIICFKATAAFQMIAHVEISHTKNYSMILKFKGICVRITSILKGQGIMKEKLAEIK